MKAAASSTREFLLRVISSLWNPDDLALARRLARDDLDWVWVARKARRHGLSSLVCEVLTGADTSCPAGPLASLQQGAVWATSQSMRLLGELRVLLERLGEAGVPVIPMGGPALSAMLFDDPLRREATDLDLLFHRDDVQRVKRLLLERGYRPGVQQTPAAEERQLERDCEWPFVRDDAGILVEVHWRLLPHQRFSSAFLWDNPRSCDVAGMSMAVPRDEELFLLLSIHGGDKHSWSLLKWVADIGMLVARGRLDGYRLVRLAERVGRLQSVVQSLSLLSQLFGLRPPVPLADVVTRDTRSAHLAALAQGRLLGRRDGLPGFQAWREFLAGAAVAHAGACDACRSPLRERLAFVRALATPEFADRQAVAALPGCLEFLSYFYRPMRLLCRNGVACVGRMA